MTEQDRVYLGNLITDKLGMCSCGNNAIVIGFILSALKALKKYHGPDWDRTDIEAVFRGDGDTGDTLFFWMALYFLDRSDLIEHGCSIRCSWLTDEGNEFLEKFGEMTGEEIHEELG